MEHIFQNSKLLMQSESFYKVTGRLFVENFESIKKRHIQFDNVFVKIEGDKRWWHPQKSETQAQDVFSVFKK